MSKCKKIRTVAGISAGSIAAIHMINKLIFSTSTALHVTDTDNRLAYRWRHGCVSYTKKGTGSPILLIHDLGPTGSTYEWSRIQEELAETHTVYAIDLLGCGYSDRPELTYTAYLYVQLINDFVQTVISRETEVVATGRSAPLVLMAAYSNKKLFTKIKLINPLSISESTKQATQRECFLSKILLLPVIGISVYNMFVSKEALIDQSNNKLFYNSKIPNNIINVFHEDAHLGGFQSRYLLSSMIGHYLYANVTLALGKIAAPITIIKGEYAENAQKIAAEYQSYDSSIVVKTIPRAKHLPQLERAVKFIKALED